MLGVEGKALRSLSSGVADRPSSSLSSSPSTLAF